MACSRTVPQYGKYSHYRNNSCPSLTLADREKAKRHSRIPPRRIDSYTNSGICHGSHAANIRTRGAHEFYNMMWDPSVCRGRTSNWFMQVELKRCKKKRNEDENLVKKRRYPRKFQLRNMLGGIMRPPMDASAYRDKVRLEDMGMQTSQYLEEMTCEITNNEESTQTDAAAKDREVLASMKKPFFKQILTGMNQGCQTDSCYTYPFDEIIKPIERNLTDKLLEQSLIETQQEMELELIRQKKRKYLQDREREMRILRRLADAQRTVADDRAVALANEEVQAHIEDEAESKIAAAVFASNCMSRLVPITFGLLKSEGYISNTLSPEIFERLSPFSNEAVEKYYREKMEVPRAILDEMLHEVVDKRESEIAHGEWSPEHQRETPITTTASTRGSMPFSVDADIDSVSPDIDHDITSVRWNHVKDNRRES